jgi:S1-C subfamily serine protease
MNPKTHLKLTYSLIILVIISQLSLSVFLTIQTKNISSQLALAKSQLQSQLNSNELAIQSLNTKTTLISSNLTSIQLDFQRQIGTIKATTSADFSGIIELALQSTVSIQTDVAQGSGFFIAPEYIVTNAHVLSGAKYARVLTYDGNSRYSKLIGYDTNMDIALLKINENYPKLDLANSDDIKVGEKVIALGNPLGLSFTATEGIVSALNRKGDNGLNAYIQTDVSLNPGNSGGALIDSSGKVIGINNFKLSNAEGIGFALESNYIKSAVNQIANQTLI